MYLTKDWEFDESEECKTKLKKKVEELKYDYSNKEINIALVRAVDFASYIRDIMKEGEQWNQ